MDIIQSTHAFAALSQPTRLEVLRALVKTGEIGMLAGDLGALLDVRQNTMSANLAVLLHAGLVRNQREGRAVRYFADFDGLRGILSFLMEDCCGGRPALCQPIINEIACACVPEDEPRRLQT
ncbi:MAG: metalloregulator ArsR/SmtB family transcription factor [Ahrensia sp.]|nr:metalloregulator ArsR/SmtB family transcription factor [Ahrensia sp.]